ncbi:MAG TPA: shikimate dehydrogenase [Candidatus Hungatella pullicola]|nr:shikimate dehydrogenase [Candidatus Hungatella pullicola]
MISGKSKVCGVMAWPVEHSLSPLMHNFYSEKTDTDLVYIPLKVEPGQIEAAVKGAYALNFAGMNITVPHKQEVMKYLVEMDEAAGAIGAVNTLVRVEGGFKGYNTDAEGLWRAMAGAGITVKGRTCLLLGAGGAAKAAAYVLAREGARKLYILNRSLEKGIQLAEMINSRFPQAAAEPLRLSEYGRIQEMDCLALQTTSVGMDPNIDCAPVEDEKFYSHIGTGVDIVYTPAETKFMRYVKQAGGSVLGGLDMLIYQGMIAYELWNPSVKFSKELVDDARRLLRTQLEAKK